LISPEHPAHSQHDLEIESAPRPGLSIDWIDAAPAPCPVEQGMRRNLLRSLSLDAMAVSLDRN